jgi:hypothetical protein
MKLGEGRKELAELEDTLRGMSKCYKAPRTSISPCLLSHTFLHSAPHTFRPFDLDTHLKEPRSLIQYHTYYTSAIMTLPDEVDILVLGGGSCGCVVAGRLANLDHNLQVMLVEAGESNLNNPW